jgi:hypothetical protein
MTDEISLLTLVCAILAGLIVIGLMVDWFHRHVQDTRRDHVMYGVERPRLSIAATRRWEKRLAQLHVIDPGEGERVRLIPKENPS